jgi:hypothetical protein
MNYNELTIIKQAALLISFSIREYFDSPKQYFRVFYYFHMKTTRYAKGYHIGFR